MIALKLRMAIVMFVCRLLLPRNVFVGKLFGAYTQRFDVVLGRLDCRGILQGIQVCDITEPK